MSARNDEGVEAAAAEIGFGLVNDWDIECECGHMSSIHKHGESYCGENCGCYRFKERMEE